ncbi:carbon starvation protein A [candidate division KSB1 bacterium]|nr:carbon starvation protein A [candidate division KSB1 bacterium]
MSATLLLLIGVVLLLGGYLLYGSFIARRLGVDPARKTPAHSLNDGVDYVPARAPVLLGHHFASIAGAAPIIGPIIAVMFGWLPVFLWIVIGGIFIGAAHDFSSLIASVRHQGRSIGVVIEEQIGRSGKLLFLIFSWSTLILIIAVFTIIVAGTFERVPSAATSSMLFILLALIFGQSVYRWRWGLGLSTIIGVILLGGCVVLGLRFPIQFSATGWKFVLFVYIFCASVIPVWVLLQPRDYLNAFLLYALMLGGLIGVVAFNPTIQMAAVTAFKVEKLGFLFPVLFITVACGAVSGFHSLVSSGTTAKQLSSEADARPIGYGAMLIESGLAILALITAAMLIKGDYIQIFQEKGSEAPVAIFSQGMGTLLSKLGVPTQAGTSFAALAVSAFALTSLDTGTRLARFAFQEFFSRGSEEGPSIWTNRYFGSGVTVGAAGVLVFSGVGLKIWPLFGTANQLLAALALLAITVWMTRRKRSNGFARYPMYFMFMVTLSALGVLVWHNFTKGSLLIGFIAVLLFGMAVVLVVQALKTIREAKTA